MNILDQGGKISCEKRILACFLNLRDRVQSTIDSARCLAGIFAKCFSNFKNKTFKNLMV